MPIAASAIPGAFASGVGAAADPLERRVAAVARQQQPGDDHDAAPTTGSPITRYQGGEVRRARRQVVPEPVLEVVDEREEHGRDERGRDPDQRAEPDQAQVGGAAQLRSGGGHRT